MKGWMALLPVAAALAGCSGADEPPPPPAGETQALQRAGAMLAERPDTAQQKGPARE